MDNTRIEQMLNYLCLQLPSRRVGSKGNRAATAFFAARCAELGFVVETPVFDCIDWVEHGAQLHIGQEAFAAQVGPYSLGGDVQAPLQVIDTVAALETTTLSGHIVLLHGEIAKEQLMPKNFPFYNPAQHQHIIALLEAKQPLAIIAATTQDVGLAGAVSPFPLIEDGDFDIPSVYMTAAEGQRLARYAGQPLSLRIDAARSPTEGCNVVARRGQNFERRLVFFAHIDAKDGTPGAIDNATGVVILLLLAELLSDYDDSLGVEIVALNGEDYYDASGEKLYVAQNEGRFDEIVLGINIDGVGYRDGHTAYSHYDCPPPIEAAIRQSMAAYSSLAEGEPWYQSDHGLFLMHQRPALALTSSHFTALWTEIAHTPDDVPAIVDPQHLREAALALRDLLGQLA